MKRISILFTLLTLLVLPSLAGADGRTVTRQRTVIRAPRTHHVFAPRTFAVPVFVAPTFIPAATFAPSYHVQRSFAPRYNVGAQFAPSYATGCNGSSGGVTYAPQFAPQFAPNCGCNGGTAGASFTYSNGFTTY